MIAGSKLTAFQDSSAIKQPTLGINYFNKSAALFHTNLDSAIIYMELAYPELKKEEDWPKYIECFSALSLFHYTNSNFGSFEYFAEMALTEAEKYLEPNHIKFADIYNNLYAFHSLNGINRKSIDLLRKSLEIRQINNENDFQLSIAFQNLGTAYSRLGEGKKAIEYIEYALELRVKSDSVPEYDIHFADGYSSLADVFNLAGDYDSSIKNYKKSLSILNHEKCQKSRDALNLKITALLQIAENLMRLNQLDQVNVYLDQVFKLYKNDIDIRLPTSLYLRALFYYKNENYSEALKHISEAIDVSQKTNNETAPPLKAKRFNLQGDIHLQLNNLDLAIQTYDQGLSTLGMSIKNEPDEEIDFVSIQAKSEALNLLRGKSKTLKLKAISLDTKEAWKQCFNSYYKTVGLLREMRTEIVTAESKNVLASNSMQVYEEALGAAYKILEFGKDENISKNIFEIIESNKALLLLESYNKQLALGNEAIPKEMLDLEYDLKLDISHYAKEISTERRKEEIDEAKILELQLNLQKTSQKNDSLIYKFNDINPDFDKYKNQIAPISLSSLQQVLRNSNNTILEYFYGPKFLFLMLINENKIEFLKLDNTNLKTEIDKLRSELSFESSINSGNQGFERFYNISNGLYRQLIKPIIPYIEKDHTNITIIPDGYISSIPFDILVSGYNEDVTPGFSPDHLNYLIEDYNISFAYSSTLLAKDQSTTTPAKHLESLIAFAPVFGGSNTAQERACKCDNIQLQKLKCNVSESESVANIFSGVIYSNDSANKKTFLSNTKNYNIIHIASHACVDQEDGMLNQIFLSDGGITNYEIYNSNLNAELTVLSACNTGIGEIQNGEGVLNLAKGFLMAGSKSALMSLWSVNDCTTSELMQSFYSNLKKGDSRNKAIREAKLNFLANANKLHAHPYYWGAFVHYGKNDPINESRGFGKFYWAVLLILMVVAVGYFFKN